jgi:hypothetical protein
MMFITLVIRDSASPFGVPAHFRFGLKADLSLATDRLRLPPEGERVTPIDPAPARLLLADDEEQRLFGGSLSRTSRELQETTAET